MCGYRRKLIGARYYTSTGATSARDVNGHGTHTASTAVGAHVDGVSDGDLALGTAKGGEPGCRIAAYKVCNTDGCPGSALLKAIDDAVNDGVDLISMSIGMKSESTRDYLSDPLVIGAFHAEDKGFMVIVSAGNEGPDPSTIGNLAPWLFTVAASNIDRDFQSSLILGSGKVLRVSIYILKKFCNIHEFLTQTSTCIFNNFWISKKLMINCEFKNILIYLIELLLV